MPPHISCEPVGTDVEAKPVSNILIIHQSCNAKCVFHYCHQHVVELLLTVWKKEIGTTNVGHSSWQQNYFWSWKHFNFRSRIRKWIYNFWCGFLHHLWFRPRNKIKAACSFIAQLAFYWFSMRNQISIFHLLWWPNFLLRNFSKLRRF